MKIGIDKRTCYTIGLAWTYANSDMHLGHMSPYVPADVLARFLRAKKFRVLLVSGTDCHGTAITERAAREGTTPEKIVAHYHEQFKEVFEKMHFSFDCYTTTETYEHACNVQTMVNQLYDRDLLYFKEEPASFCTHCNKFINDREAEVICPKCGSSSKGDQCGNCNYVFLNEDLLHAKCRVCGNPTEVRTNKNIYFKLSAFSKDIREFAEYCKPFWRKNTYNETIKFLNEGLKDRTITRDTDFGIKVPLLGFEDKRIYVWIDALWGYITATKLACEKYGWRWEDFLTIEKYNSAHMYLFHGKDNIIFHSIVFPALLMGCDRNYILPFHCVSSEFMNINGEKMSKSKGNGFTMIDLLKIFNADSLRFYLIANGPERKDSSFTFEEYHNVHNGELINKFANFISRTVNFKGLEGYLPKGQLDERAEKKILETFDTAGEHLMNANFKDALNSVMELVEFGNKYYDEKAPWTSFKQEDKTEFNNTIYTCVQICAALAELMAPFMPDTAAKLKDFLGLPGIIWEFRKIPCGANYGKLEPLFTRLKAEDTL